MTDPEFRADLVERCTLSAIRRTGNVVSHDVTTAILDESGHAELVTALEEAREYIEDRKAVLNRKGAAAPLAIDVLTKIDIALKKAGAP